TLETLPHAEWRSGHGEMAKYAFLGAEGLEAMGLDEQVEACVRLKAGVVVADEREGGLRMTLNYGHTLAHGLEAAGLASGPGRRFRHGEAVAIGLAFAARLARALGRIDDERVLRHEEVLASYELAIGLPADVDRMLLVEFMGRDKKAHGDLTFVLDGPDGVEVVGGVPRSLVEAVLSEMPGANSERLSP
ncbi:MAG: 3-dehydroquinate synthase family protein, partial [Acidimicrobiales bacterium]